MSGDVNLTWSPHPTPTAGGPWSAGVCSETNERTSEIICALLSQELEGSEAEGEHLRTELQLARHEVTSLKRLVTGKDALLMRKGQALDQAKVSHHCDLLSSLPEMG